MEIQCILKFTGDKMMVNKARQGTVIHAEQSLILKKCIRVTVELKFASMQHLTSFAQKRTLQVKCAVW